ncbi:class I SAM-dependent methyltransferase [Patulibacter brassicae]|jgi:SAM-dependent methyltransferase|uniref:Class I SAM-dependent methyltransferase n=1 Tax=Patulibacter brassicae TaxID=1705717 RepID=A0ABU4VHA0_9ACTN|nr:class I SAM-dependent methyltransferase [Patulibacter brassicae]MDX8151183.1 class I SAM-dependent methyltransferase [Patulibacter brassicae]
MAEVQHPRFARVWSRLMRHEPPAVRRARAELAAGLRGRVLEIGCGTGSMFEHYPDAVTEVVALEPEPLLYAEARATAAARPVTGGPTIVVRPEPIEDVPAADLGTFDAVVCSLVLCSVPDPVGALRTARGLLRPGGELRYYEHVATDGALGGFQRALDATVWPRAFGGCHTHRHTARAIDEAGFVRVQHRDVRAVPRWVPLPISPIIMGAARSDA